MTAQLTGQDRGRFSVNPALTGNASEQAGRLHRRDRVENDTYMAFCARIIRAAGRRISAGDVDTLPELAQLQHDLDQALTHAVRGLRDFGYSWTEIAVRLGVTRQAAQQRWGEQR